MLNITVTGDRIVIDGLNQFGAEFPKAVDRGLTRIVKGTFNEAFAWLSGPGGAGKAKRKDYTGFQKKGATGEAVTFRSFIDSGGYPVPVRTGNLRRLLDWLKPGASKAGFSAARNEAIVYNSAEYASAIHNGTGSSAKFGRRPFLDDAFTRFNAGAQLTQIMEDELQKEINKARLN